MLIQFSFNNYKCFKDETVLNLVAPYSKKNKDYFHTLNRRNSILKSAVVYGANASGKTKLFEAFQFFKFFICPPNRDQRVPILDYWQTKYDAFRLNTDSKHDSSFFEAIFLIDDIQYRYGVELNDSDVLSEWLYSKKIREKYVFIREKDLPVKFNREQINSKIADNILSADMVSPTSSFLAVLKTFNEPLASKIVSWFNHVIVISANDIRIPESLHHLKTNKKEIVSFLKSFDFNIEDLKPHEMNIDDLPVKIKSMISEKDKSGTWYDGFSTSHKCYNSLYERVDDVWFSLERDESFGTNRLFWLSSAIISSIQNGTVLFIDEFDSGIHTIIASKLIELFYRSHSKAQLIFNTHNSSLLTYKNDQGKMLFLKDQVFFVNKNRYGESTLSALTDFGSSSNSNLETLYLDGNFGGVPYINDNSLIDLVNK